MPKNGKRLKEFPDLVIAPGSKVFELLETGKEKDKIKAIKLIKELIK